MRIVVHVSEILFYKVLHENFSNRYLGVKISNKIISESSSCLLFYFHVFFFFFFFLREELCPLVDWKGLGKCGWTVCDVLYKTFIVEVAGRPCMHILAFSRFSLESVL